MNDQPEEKPMPDRFRPDAAVRRVVPIQKPARSGAALFEDHGPTASVGRRSFPRSHRGEGRNFVD